MLSFKKGMVAASFAFNENSVKTTEVICLSCKMKRPWQALTPKHKAAHTVCNDIK